MYVEINILAANIINYIKNFKVLGDFNIYVGLQIPLF